MANNQSVRRYLDAFNRCRIIVMLEEGRSVTSVAAEFGIAHSIVASTIKQCLNNSLTSSFLSMGRRCETCLAVRGDHIPTKDRMFLAGHPSQGCFGLQSHCIALDATFSIKLLFIPLISLLVSVAYIAHVLTYWGSYGIKCVDLESFGTKLY
ncbi:hypothetical protein TNCV_4657891 [Trichonephila clavipes]|nr:hypothetical protein TNCV_4657891 [Trichonephila clavipes]